MVQLHQQPDLSGSGTMNSGTHLQRITGATIIGIVALYCDNFASSNQRPALQAGIWTIGIFAVFTIELRRTLRRQRPRAILIAIFFLHMCVLRLVWPKLPFESSFPIFFYIFVECIGLSIVYLRLCQALDPQGPFGWTEADSARRDALRLTGIKLFRRK